MVQISLWVVPPHPTPPPPPPSTITHIMYLKCLLHNLCSINFCFKGCDTTSAYYFPRLCSFWALCLIVSWSIDWFVFVCVSPQWYCRAKFSCTASSLESYTKHRWRTWDNVWFPGQNIRKTTCKQKWNVLIFQLSHKNLQWLVRYFRYFKRTPGPETPNLETLI